MHIHVHQLGVHLEVEEERRVLPPRDVARVGLRHPEGEDAGADGASREEQVLIHPRRTGEFRRAEPRPQPQPRLVHLHGGELGGERLPIHVPNAHGRIPRRGHVEERAACGAHGEPDLGLGEHDPAQGGEEAPRLGRRGIEELAPRGNVPE